MIASDAFDLIASDLRVLRLPKELKHLGQGSLDSLPPDATVEMEGLSSGINNAILQPDGMFSDKCCRPGKTLFGFTFCDMGDHQPGIDSSYEPWLFPRNTKEIEVLTPFSPLYAEASDSVEKCAEYCKHYYAPWIL